MKPQDLGDFLRASLALAVDHRDVHALAQRTALDAADADGAYVGRVIEQRHLQLQRAVDVHVGRRAMIDDGFEQHARVGPVDLVDDHDRLQATFQGLGEHEAGLRHRSVHGVDQQQHAVDHGENALDFTAEIGVARRVDDVDVIVVPRDRGVLRQDGDAALALEGVRIHDALLQVLTRVERAGLA